MRWAPWAASSTETPSGAADARTAGDDVLDASASSLGVTFYGGAGNDTISGSQAGDHLAGGSGDDEIHGLAGAGLHRLAHP